MKASAKFGIAQRILCTAAFCMFAMPLMAAVGTAPDTMIGRHVVRTIPVAPDIVVISATYTPSGKVLLTYRKTGETDGRNISLATMNDDGSAIRTFFSQRLPDRPKDNGIRYMVFPDNRRIFTGDFVIECKVALEKCDRPAVIPVQFPANIADGPHIAFRWSEIIVAPDNLHISWTTLLSNYSAVVLTGALKKSANSYVIAKTNILSPLAAFVHDPKHADGMIPQIQRGGEVKQFVHGGKAISMVGAVKRDIANSTLLDLQSGALQAITDTPGYTETTIFAPDELLGLAMTTRFSPATDLAILGLLPRPYPASLNVGLNMFAYTNGVTAVRKSKPGNVGPALIDIAASQGQDGYLGINLNTDTDWVYDSPMSWHRSSKKAMWMEIRRGGSDRRIQIVELPDYSARPKVPTKATPDSFTYSSANLSAIPGLIEKSQNIDVKVYGRASGYIAYRREAARIEKRYDNYSDDGLSFLSGFETTEPNPRGNSTYTANLRLNGEKLGAMDLKITFASFGGDDPAGLVFGVGTDGLAKTRGYSEYQGKRLEIDDLRP